MNFNKSYSVCSKFLFLLRTNSGCIRSSRTAHIKSVINNRTFCPELRSVSSFVELQKKCGSAYSSLPKENLFCHKILEDSSNYSLVKYSSLDLEINSPNALESSVQDLLSETDFLEITAHELCELFKKVSIDTATKTFLPMSDKAYTDMCSAIERMAKDFTDNQLANLLLYACFWPMSPNIRADNFEKFWRALDAECLVRWRDWPIKKMFYFIDLWFTFRLIRMSDFVFNCLNYLGKKPGRLSSRDVVQLFFYINAVRTASRGMNMFDLECRLEECMASLSLAEIGIVALGFFKTQTRIVNPQLVRYIIHRLISEIDTVSEITLAAILKCIRLSMSISVWCELPRLLDALVPHLNNFSLQCDIHIALLTTTSQTLHPPTLEPIVIRLLKELSSARLKDIEKVLLVISQYNWLPPGDDGERLIDQIVSEVQRPERVAEAEMHAKSLIAIVNYLTVIGHFPYELINKVLNMDLIINTYGKNKYSFSRELLGIDNRVEIHCPDYTGNRLSPEIANYLSMRYSQYLPNPQMKMSNHAQFLHDIKTNLDSVFGPNKAAYVYTVPFHPRADIIYRTGVDGPLPADILKRKPFTGTIPAPQDGSTWHAVIGAGKNMYLSDKTTPNGETQAKLRALDTLGYTSHMISIYDWQNESGKKDMREFLIQQLGL